MADCFHCIPGKLPFIYLGLPVGAISRKRETWAPVIEKFKKKLSSWNARLLSIGGRRTLICSALNALPIFYLSSFLAPKAVISELDAIRRNFFWGMDDSGNHIYWVSWEKIMAPKCAGGLEMKNLSLVNLSLLAKWIWRFLSEKSSLWKGVIQGIYGAKGGIGLSQSASGSTWGSILKGCKLAERVNFNVFKSFKRSVGNGEDTSFWSDVWCHDEESLKVLFPRLFALESQKNCRVSDRLVEEGAVWKVKWDWTSLPRGRCIAELDSISALLHSRFIFPHKQDVWRWSPD